MRVQDTPLGIDSPAHLSQPSVEGLITAALKPKSHRTNGNYQPLSQEHSSLTALLVIGVFTGSAAWQIAGRRNVAPRALLCSAHAVRQDKM